MASEIHRNNVRISLVFFLIAFSYILSIGFVNGRRISNSIVRNTDLIYTIEGEDGDIIDCIDIYKQPAFSHPLLKNHTIQMRPSSNPNGLLRRSNTESFQDWNKKGKCPKGTIPIARTQNIFNHRKSNPIISKGASIQEYAQVSVEGFKLFGAHARLNVWNPTTLEREMSVAQIWVLAGYGQDVNAIEAGWRVFSGEKKTRLSIYWTRDAYQSTGCYNLNCPGFVQTNSKIALGAAISPLSTYNGNQKAINITIHKDMRSGNWWLQVQDQELGYWPASILTSLAESSNRIYWGGEITNLQSNHHTSTQMGSGHFASEGFQKASVFCNLGYIDNSGSLKDPEFLRPYLSEPSCYDLKVGEKGEHGFGVHFYFGGPGYSPQCL